jgi:hypothetical protein
MDEGLRRNCMELPESQDRAAALWSDGAGKKR